MVRRAGKCDSVLHGQRRFSFRGGQQDQMVLFGDTPDTEPLRQALQDRFSDAGWVSIGDVLA